MISLESLKNMAKNGEIKEELLQSGEFKEEIKKILNKEKKIEVTDEQICDIIENFEKALKYGIPLSEEELENVAGGATTKSEKIKTKTTFLGDITGYAVGQAFNVYVLNPWLENLDFVKKAKNGSYGTISNFIISKTIPWLTYIFTTSVTVFVGSRIGGKIGDSICKSLDTEEVAD